MDMSHEFTPSGEGSKTSKLGSQREHQPVTGSAFDTKIKALFANRDYYNDSHRILALERVESTLASDDRFTDSWWEGLYKWLDEKDFHTLLKQAVSTHSSR